MWRIALAGVALLVVAACSSSDVRIGADPDALIDSVRWRDGEDQIAVRQDASDPDVRIRSDLSTAASLVLDVWGGDPPPLAKVSAEESDGQVPVLLELSDPPAQDDIGIYHILEIEWKRPIHPALVTLAVDDNR